MTTSSQAPDFEQLTMVIRNQNFGLKEGYQSRIEPIYFDDTSTAEETGVVHQQSIYDLAGFLAERDGIKTIIDIGCGSGKKLCALAEKHDIIGVDFGINLKHCRSAYDFGEWIDWDLESHKVLALPPEKLENALIICADVIEHLADPTGLLFNLQRLSNHAALILLSTPERDLVRGTHHMGPPGNRTHVREWSLNELHWLLETASLPITFIGLAENNNVAREKKCICAVISKHGTQIKQARAPEDFKVLAIMTAYNEGDILPHTISRLIDQGVHVHVVDNWSTDNTTEILEGLKSTGRLTVERFPAEGPAPYYEWEALLQRVDDIAALCDADWCIHHDADEIRQSPWADLSMRDILFAIETMGYNAVDHTVLNFPPTSQTPEQPRDINQDFRYFTFGQNPGHFVQIKCWKNQHKSVNLAKRGGHNANFDGRRIFPFKFLLRHYPIRSQSHGERKIFKDRRPRWSPAERERGWHKHYDSVTETQNFVEKEGDLHRFSHDALLKEFLVETISGECIK